MPPAAVRAVLVVALAGCAAGPDDRADRAKVAVVPSDPPSAPAASAAPPATSSAASATLDGLTLRLDAPAEVVAGTPIEVELVLRNAGERPLRLFWIDVETFRAEQSQVALVGADDRPVTPPQVSRGHGYVVGERDFPRLAPGEERRARQRIATVGLVPGAYQVRWSYANAVDRWTGARGMLDGPGVPLFGGGPIPEIWLGEARVSAPVVITADPAAPPSIGSATIAADGTITLTLRATDGRGAIGDGRIIYTRAHPDYEKVRAHTGLDTVGQVVEVRSFPERW